MDNETKRYLSGLEARVMRLERVIEAMNMGMQQGADFRPTCNQCGAYDPHNNGYVCGADDCCQGLNPNEDG